MDYRIPLFDLNFNWEEEEAVVQTLRSKWISIGPKCEELETQFSQILHVNHAVSLANCTAALHLALIALGVKPGDEVLCPSLSFAATANAIKYVGARTVFCDITSAEDPTISPDEIEFKITKKTKAIIVMHYAGFPCNMNQIMKIAQSHGIPVIEDACHAPLSEYNGKKLGTIGDIGCFSFFSNKNIATGEGGMIVTNGEEIARRVKLLRSHGMTTMSYERSKGHATTYDIVELGYNYRMDDIRATIGIVQLCKLKDDLEKRANIRSYYIDLLRNEDRIVIPFNTDNQLSSNYIFPIVIKKDDTRDDIREYMHKEGVQTSIHYPPIHRFSIYREEYLELPVTDLVANNTLTLPMYGKLTHDDVEYIIQSLKKALDQN